ncbi:MAG: APC family permease [Acidimicrobiaceae bacterium]|nr:APC family permease [Acidimicrobiaceae bacterium]
MNGYPDNVGSSGADDTQDGVPKSFGEETREIRIPEVKSPQAFPITGSIYLPETLSYRLKNKLLGQPLVTDKLSEERLSKSIALAILSSDVMSSSAYATEQILTILIPVVGIAAFSLVVPVSIMVLVVLTFVTASYLEVIKAYPRAGGAYVVARDNFGLKVAQVAGVSLLIDYTLTVAVSVSAGTDALTSAIPALDHYNVVLSVIFVMAIAFGNLRGIREAGKTFALPTFLFIFNMGVLIMVGLIRGLLGQLSQAPIHVSGGVAVGHAGSGLLYGASLFIFLKAFANGGTALTGTEAISNGVSIFKNPQPRNARITLVAMSVILGIMFFGVSILARFVHAVPRISGSPTVLSLIAAQVYGHSPIGRFAFYFLQVSTYAILVLAANTSFTGFPFLASFAAEDSFLPRQFSRRGHRLTFSNGIIVLTILAEVLIIATRARVSALISLYAIGVFTGFTMAGAGMVKHHLVKKGDHWKRRAVINGAAAVLSLLVDLIFAVTKFTSGAWVILVVAPILVFSFIRLNKQYRNEEEELESGVSLASEVPAMRRHVVIVMVDRLDLATARALEYAKALVTDEIRAVHFVLANRKARELEKEWSRLATVKIDLEFIEVVDRRLRRAALELVAEVLADRETEVTVLLPRRAYPRIWSRVLHDQTADSIADVISQLPHVNATIVPFHVAGVSSGKSKLRVQFKNEVREQKKAEEAVTEEITHELVPGSHPIGSLPWRTTCRIAGRVKSVRVQSLDSVPSLAARVEDPTGGLLLVFAGRRSVPGMEPGRLITAVGVVGDVGGHLAMMNPDYEFLASPDGSEVG